MLGYKYIFFIHCVQNSFIGLGEARRAVVHVGKKEAERLAGANGALRGWLQYALKSPRALFVFINDEHDPEQDSDHLKVFGDHAIQGTQGAKIIDPFDELVRTAPNCRVVQGGALEDLSNGTLERELGIEIKPGDFDDTRIGVLGVWTDAKVYHMIHTLRQTYLAPHVSTCSALTASNSNEAHFAALERIKKIQGANVLHSPLSFLLDIDPEFDAPEAKAVEQNPDYKLVFPEWWTEEYITEFYYLLESLVPGQKSIHQFGGGFSGCMTMRIDNGTSRVVKIGLRDEIAGEHQRNYFVKTTLRRNIPALGEFRELKNLAGFSMTVLEGEGKRETKPMTFQDLWETGSHSVLGQCIQALKQVFGKSLLAMYTGDETNLDLFRAYMFTAPDGTAPFGHSIAKSATEVACEQLGLTGKNPSDPVTAFLKDWLNVAYDPRDFYLNWLPGKELTVDAIESRVHADLNLQNILLQIDAFGDVIQDWIIDFARISRLPVVTDFAKVENDLSYILCPCKEAEDMQRRVKLQQWFLDSEQLLIEKCPFVDELSDQEYYLYELVRTLRQQLLLYVDDNEEAGIAYRVAQLRYAAHTLSFDEPTPRQRGLALLACSELTRQIRAFAER